MTTAFMLYDLRRSRPILALVTAVAMGLVLLLPGPLQGYQPSWFHTLGVVCGLVLAARLLSDTEGTQSYVLSRGITKRRIFLLRAVLGFAVILALGLLLWLPLALGLRDRLHGVLQSPDAMFYPMSGQFEFAVIKPFVACAMCSFGLMSFYMTWRGLCYPSWNSTSGGLARLVLFEAPAIVLMLGMGLMVVDAGEVGPPPGVLLWLPVWLAAGALVLSWIAVRNVEAG